MATVTNSFILSARAARVVYSLQKDSLFTFAECRMSPEILIQAIFSWVNSDSAEQKFFTFMQIRLARINPE